MTSPQAIKGAAFERAVFDAESVALVLHEDGTVTWHHVSDSEREEHQRAR